LHRKTYRCKGVVVAHRVLFIFAVEAVRTEHLVVTIIMVSVTS
jgi:hypothetical protein